MPELLDASLWPKCQHGPFEHCPCGGGIHSYIYMYAWLLAVRRPSSVQEWGPGPNTALAILSGASVLSVESEQRWIPSHLVGIPGLTFAMKGLDAPDYAETSAADVYFVDGGGVRTDCIDAALDEAHPATLICIHDAQRPFYHDHMRRAHEVWFMDPGFAVCAVDAEGSAWIAKIRERR